MAKLNDLCTCERCGQLVTVRDTVISLVKGRRKLCNRILCITCARKSLEDQEGA